MRRFGIIGNPLEHSFSSKYFNKKFLAEDIRDATYENFLLDTAEDLPLIIQQFPDLIGLNVTTPFKEQIFHYLDVLDEAARGIGAVNTIHITHKESQVILKGFNTDAPAFQQIIQPIINESLQALVLGSGGASKAVCYALEKMNIEYQVVSRDPADNQVPYHALDEGIITAHLLIINTTPLGMFPKVNSFPDIPFEFITDNHILYDLIYNPEQTEFLKRGRQNGAQTVNGLEMLQVQAELAWTIWND